MASLAGLTSKQTGKHADSVKWRAAVRQGPAEHFTGTVRIDPLFSPPDPAPVAGALVTFEPGARAAWHTHPLGQTLFVIKGLGWVQREGWPIEEIRLGDVVSFAPGGKHRDGATPTTAMSPIAIQEKRNGAPVDRIEHVTDTQYQRDVEHFGGRS
jgi:quercetin dioxygenase-like cupin family protein